MVRKKQSNIDAKIEQFTKECQLADFMQRKKMARSVSVGSAGGGIIEVSMRGDFADLFMHLKPPEVMELIGQLAAGSGIEICARPKNDFSSWRSWDPSLPESVAWLGAAPWQLSESDREELYAAKVKSLKQVDVWEEKSSPKILPESQSEKKDEV